MATACALLLPAPEARACGALVQPQTGSLGADAQRAFFSVRGDRTEVVLQVMVPQTTQDFGVLVPMPAQPTVSADPVDVSELDALDEATRPVILEDTGDTGPSCGCGGALAGDARNGVDVGQQLVVGPVEVVTLTGEDGSAITAWLNEHGFTIPAAQQSTVDSYAGAGHWFVAFKRAQTSGSISAVGVQLTLPGDQRGYALKMARIGAGEEMSFVIFVSHTAGVAPSFPYAALTLHDLDKATVRHDGYAAAVRQAVAAHEGRAFVIEGIRDRNALALGSRLQALTEPNHKITRLSSTMKPADLTADVTLNAPPPEDVPASLDVSTGTVGGPHGNPGGGPGLLLLTTIMLLLWSTARRSIRVPHAT
ncbi:MAG: DUF2330 domain-containing protein [Myxococcota bacterium]